MSTKTIRRYLQSQDVRYVCINFVERAETLFENGTPDIKPRQLARAVILKDLRGLLMAIIPGPCQLDVPHINQLLHRNLQPAESADYQQVFHDCDVGVIPPLGNAYGMETIIDEALLDLEYVYFQTGAQQLTRISAADFRLLHSNAWYGNSFTQISHPGDYNVAVKANAYISRKPDMLENQIPAMPEIATEIIQMNTNPMARAQDLADLLEQDPVLCAQIIRVAKSPFYGYNGEINSIRQVISRVLGFDLVMNIALGIALAKPFEVPVSGPLGLHAFWRHATYSAALTHSLCHLLPRRIRPKPSCAYLSGLLHNIGLLLLGHLYKKDFNKLNQKYSETKNHISLRQLEEQVFDRNHCDAGVLLMEHWKMPEYIRVVVAHHHEVEYNGASSTFNQLTLMADCLLKSQGIGDGENDALPVEILNNLGLNESQVLGMLDKTLTGRKELDKMAEQLVA